ncbi:hypothetical protein HD554DRAFT_2021767, partial [Boletus coccyginus]
SLSNSSVQLLYFIVHALLPCKTSPFELLATLVLLHPLKEQFPTARGLSVHHPFITVFLVIAERYCQKGGRLHCYTWALHTLFLNVMDKDSSVRRGGLSHVR